MGIDIIYYAGVLNTVTLYFWDDSSRLDARVSPIPSGSTGLNGARRFTNPDHRGHFLVVGTRRIHRQLCTRTQTQAMLPIRTQESLLPGTGDVQQLAPRVNSSRSALVTPRYCTVGRSGSGSDFAAVASFRGYYHIGGASITQFGRTRNYYFNTHTHTHPLKHLQKQKSHIHQHQDLQI